MPTTLERAKKNIESGQPKYEAVAKRLRAQIESHELRPGDRLPTYAELRAEFGATATTVERIYSLLEQEGLVERQPRRGLFVAERKRVLTGNIGLVGSPLLQNQQDSFYIHINQGVQSAASQHGRRLLLTTNYEVDHKLFAMVDGLLLSGHSVETNQRILQEAPAHLGRVSMFTSMPGMTCVIADEYRGGKLAVEHLVAKGHQRIACLMSQGAESLGHAGRLTGYCNAMQEAGIAIDERWKRVVASDGLNSQFNHLSWGRQQMQDWLDQGWRELGCTALVVQNDQMAIGAMQVLNEARISVPHEVSVIGFDGTELCEHVVPKLTSIRLPLFEVGVKATELLIQQIESGKQEEQIIVLPATLRPGNSVAAI